MFDKIIKETIIKANADFKAKSLSELVECYSSNDSIISYYTYDDMEEEVMTRLHKGFNDFGADVGYSHITNEIIKTYFIKLGNIEYDDYYSTEIYIKISDIPKMILGEETYEELLHEEPIKLTI